MSIFAHPPLAEPIHITISRSARDPRAPLPDLPGIVVHEVPELHPDDVCTVRGIPCTSVARTLIDLADDMGHAELREVWARGFGRGLVELDAIRASRSRVEWRASLVMVDRLIAEFSV